MKPDTCGCCEPPKLVAIDNRPSLSALAYRIGTFSSFRKAMLQAIADMPELAHLKTRLSEDYAITVLELWAVIADILTFYQERIANEAFLRTAVVRDSVLRLVRLLDYQLRPGVAATTSLAFDVEKNKRVQIPVGLRVQSVPAQNEQPQKFATLEAITADARLNRLRVLPAPIGINPLAKGSTEAILAPGADGLAIAQALAPEDRVLLFNDTAIEEPTVREIRVEGDRLLLAWSHPIQGASWQGTSPAFKFTRIFRLFGYNAPPTYMKATQPSPGVITWDLKTITVWDGKDIPKEDSYGLKSGTELYLESRYENMKVGSRLLVSDSGGQNTLVTVTKVSQAQDSLGSFTDTVTRLTVFPPVPPITDRRNVAIYELDGPPIRFWGYAYPATLTAPTVYMPARTVDKEKVEIGRTISGNAYQAGVEIGLNEIDVGRKVLLLDSKQTPIAAEIVNVAVAGAEVIIGPTPADSTTAVELGFGPEQGQIVRVGLISAPLIPFPKVSSAKPELSVTIGSVGPHTVMLDLATPDKVADQLQKFFKAAADAGEAFAQAQVHVVDDRLLILSGRIEEKVIVSPTAKDSTTAVELGLDAQQARTVTGVVSGTLSSSLSLTSQSPELSVTIGTVGPHAVKLGSLSSDPKVAATQIEAVLKDTDRLAPAFAQARILLVDNRLLVLPGAMGAEIQEYLVLHVRTQTALDLATQSAMLLGNVAQASHGEPVKDEVVGDGDTSIGFQRFTLTKKPVTFTPSAGAGGVQNTLQMQVNNVRWKEVPSLYDQAPTDQVYTTRMADDGTMTVQFGDGKNGARPPSGRGNIVATYRQGLGLSGRVRANTLTTLLDRPVGLKSATNPAPASGGADPETLDTAKQHAPTTMRTFGRAVSLRDFADLVTATGEVAKARATWVWNGETRVVHLTIAGQQGGTFLPTDLARIHASLTRQRDPHHALLLDNYHHVPVVVTATLRVADTHVAAIVEAAARAALLNALSFERLDFGQPLHLSDLYRILQDVDGITWVDIDLFHFKDRSPAHLAARGATTDAVQQHLRIYPARPNPKPPPLVLPAEQAWIEAPTQDITIVTVGGLPT